MAHFGVMPPNLDARDQRAGALDCVGDRADHYVLRRVDGRWPIDEVEHCGA